jgi:crotonobetainyl-CoA:carnitine CoA-transferase CaiB-like acyl-CoA transferase
MGNDEAVTPVFPNSDYCTGVCGSTGVLHALIKRAEDGGSYGIDVNAIFLRLLYCKCQALTKLFLNHIGISQLLLPMAS